VTETKPESLNLSESWAGLLDAILSRSTGKGSHIHGPVHWTGVAAAGLCLLDQTPGADPLVVLLFALLHDSMRKSAGHDPEHGRRGAALARELSEAGAFDLDAGRLEILAHALEHHDKGETSQDPTIGVCWDSDRLNLWRVGRKPDPALLSTPAGRLAAEVNWPRMISAVKLGWLPIFLGYAARAEGEAKRVYLRFGDLPPGGRSRVDGLANWREAGVSVYPGHGREDGAYVTLDFRGLLFGLDTRYLATLLWGGRPLYIVEGQQVGVGNMGEPVLADARIVGEVRPEEVRTLPDSARFRQVLQLWRARLRGDVVGATSLLLSGGADSEERAFFPPMVPLFSGMSLSERVDALLESWGHKDLADEMRQKREEASREREQRRTQKRRERRALQELERQADPFGFGTTYPTDTTSGARTRRKEERSQWEWGSPWDNSWM